MLSITRQRALYYMGALLLQGCAGSSPGAVRVGSTNSRQNETIAEIYALALEHAKIRVERRMRFGDDRQLLSSVERKEIDVYPGRLSSDQKLLGGTRAYYERRRGLTWLAASPANVGACVAASQYAGEQLSLLTLSKCAALAPQLRLAATSEFVAGGGPLDQLRAAYGGFHFKSVSICEPGTQYYELNLNRADVANGTTTDPSVDEDQLVILADDRHVLPEYRWAPVARMAVLRSHPALGAALNRVSRIITLYALQQMSLHRDLLGMSAGDLAEEFFHRHRGAL